MATCPGITVGGCFSSELLYSFGSNCSAGLRPLPRPVEGGEGAVAANLGCLGGHLVPVLGLDPPALAVLLSVCVAREDDDDGSGSGAPCLHGGDVDDDHVHGGAPGAGLFLTGLYFGCLDLNFCRRRGDKDICAPSDFWSILLLFIGDSSWRSSPCPHPNLKGSCGAPVPGSFSMTSHLSIILITDILL